MKRLKSSPLCKALCKTNGMKRVEASGETGLAGTMPLEMAADGVNGTGWEDVHFVFGATSAAISTSALSIFTAACGSSELVPGHVS